MGSGLVGSLAQIGRYLYLRAHITERKVVGIISSEFLKRF